MQKLLCSSTGPCLLAWMHAQALRLAWHTHARAGPHQPAAPRHSRGPRGPVQPPRSGGRYRQPAAIGRYMRPELRGHRGREGPQGQPGGQDHEHRSDPSPARRLRGRLERLAHTAVHAVHAGGCGGTHITEADEVVRCRTSEKQQRAFWIGIRCFITPASVCSHHTPIVSHTLSSIAKWAIHSFRKCQ